MTIEKSLIYGLYGWFAGILVGVGAVHLLASNGIHIGVTGRFWVGFAPTLLGMVAGFVLGGR